MVETTGQIILEAKDYMRVLIIEDQVAENLVEIIEQIMVKAKD